MKRSRQRRSGGSSSRFGALLLHRRLARAYETCPASAASWIRRSMTDVITRLLTGRIVLIMGISPPNGGPMVILSAEGGL